MSAAARVEEAEAVFVSGDRARARRLLEEIEPAIHDDPALRLRVLNDLAVIAAADGRAEAADALLVQALSIDPAYGPALENLAEMCESAGDVVQACHWYRRAAEATPGEERLWRALGNCLLARRRWDEARDALERAGASPAELGPRARRAGGAQPAESSAAPAPGRVLIVVDYFHPSVGGSERLAEMAGVALQAQGWAVDVACRALPERTDLQRLGMAIHEVGPLSDLEVIVARAAYDALLVFAGPTAWPIPASLRLPEPRPRICAVPCINADNYRLVNSDPGLLAVYRELVAGADVLGVSSHSGFDARLCEELGLEGTYVPNASEPVAPTGSFRAAAEIDEGPPLLLVVGNMWPEKNHPGLLRALARHEGDWRLALIGGASPEAPHVAHEVEALAAADPRVTLAGPQPPEVVAAAMREADMLLLPSIAEATPLVLLEAMANDLPWVATPDCGAAHDHAGGLIVPVALFGEAIDFLLGESDAAAALGRAGREHWEASYTWDVMGPRYARVLAGAPVGPLDPPGEALASTDSVRTRFYDQRVLPATADAPAVAPVPESLPTVTCVMTAYNYERYVGEAIRSVLDQSYPPELLDVLVVDDGSTDRTAAVVRGLAEETGRVTLVQQENAGLGAATSRALQEASGDLIGILDADDLWLPEKVRRQVDILRAKPEVGLVYGDMRIVDADGRQVHPSFFAHHSIRPRRGRVLDELLEVNFTTNSTLLFRSEFRPHFWPIPAGCPYGDYWLVATIAALAELDYVHEPLSGYRLHGSNMGFGATGDRLLEEMRREIGFRRVALTAPLAASLSLAALVRATADMEQKSWGLLATAGTPFAELCRVEDHERKAAQAALAEAAATPDLELHLRLCSRAWALDPFSTAARTAFHEAVGAAQAVAERGPAVAQVG